VLILKAEKIERGVKISAGSQWKKKQPPLTNED